MCRTWRTGAPCHGNSGVGAGLFSGRPPDRAGPGRACGPGRWRRTAQRLSFLLVINVFQTRKEWRSTLFRLNVSRPFFPSSQLSGIVRERLLSRFFSFLVLSARGSCFPTWWTAAFGLSPRDAFARLRVLSGKRRPSLLLPLLSLPFKSPW